MPPLKPTIIYKLDIKMNKEMFDIIQLIANIASVVTAITSSLILYKVNINIKNIGNKKSEQKAKGNNNKQNSSIS